jgi:hypothetical protein
MTVTRDPKATGRSLSSSSQMRHVEMQATRLAHWPPPYRNQKAKPKMVAPPLAEEPTKARRGWRITRAVFDDDE